MKIKIIKDVIIEGAVVPASDDLITISDEVGNNLLRIECAQKIVLPEPSVEIKEPASSTKIIIPDTEKRIKKPALKGKKQGSKTRTKTLNI